MKIFPKPWGNADCSKDFCFLEVESSSFYDLHLASSSSTCVYVQASSAHSVLYARLVPDFSAYCYVPAVLWFVIPALQAIPRPQLSKHICKWREKGCTGVSVDERDVGCLWTWLFFMKKYWLPKPLSQFSHILSNSSMIYVPRVFASVDDDVEICSEKKNWNPIEYHRNKNKTFAIY